MRQYNANFCLWPRPFCLSFLDDSKPPASLLDGSERETKSEERETETARKREEREKGRGGK